MGWSCSSEANRIMNRWGDACRKNSGSTNVWSEKGKKYFYEISRKEHQGGDITGTVWKFIDETHIRRSSHFHIDGYGRIVAAPKFLRDIT